MTQPTWLKIEEAIVRLRHAFIEGGGRGPLRIVVDNKTADFVQYYAPPLDYVAARTNDPTFVATIAGVDVHSDTSRHGHAVRSLRDLIADIDSEEQQG